MSPITVPLSATEAAFVQMVLEAHRARVAIADETRDRQMAVLLSERGIPSGISVTRAVVDGVVVLQYEGPDTPDILAAPTVIPAEGEPS